MFGSGEKRNAEEQAEDEVKPRKPPDEILNWRFECLVSVGYPPQVADRIAEAKHVDLHQACKMLLRGCAPELAQYILILD